VQHPDTLSKMWTKAVAAAGAPQIRAQPVSAGKERARRDSNPQPSDP
jgi:hypothetical protein